MNAASDTIILRGAHIIDPGQGIDRVSDVAIAAGNIRSIGPDGTPPGATIIDLRRHYA